TIRVSTPADGLSTTNALSHSHDVGAWDGTSPVWLILRVTTDDGLRSDALADLHVLFWGQGVDAGVDNTATSLADTGSDLLANLLIGVIVLSTGALLMIVSFLRSRRSARRPVERLLTHVPKTHLLPAAEAGDSSSVAKGALQ
uniref:hypothetical protein n=1 Tax=Leifsonia aquatica TaxID=144185 RepID=UPI0005BD905A